MGSHAVLHALTCTHARLLSYLLGEQASWPPSYMHAYFYLLGALVYISDRLQVGEVVSTIPSESKALVVVNL